MVGFSHPLRALARSPIRSSRRYLAATFGGGNLSRTNEVSQIYATAWWSWRDSNPHARRHHALNVTCLPITAQDHICVDGRIRTYRDAPTNRALTTPTVIISSASTFLVPQVGFEPTQAPVYGRVTTLSAYA